MRQHGRRQNLRHGRDTEKTRTVKFTPTGEPFRRGRVSVGDASEDEFGERSDAKSGERTGPVAKSERHRESGDDYGEV